MRTDRIQFQLYITAQQHSQIERMREAGFNVAAQIRLAIRKCKSLDLNDEDDSPRPIRIQIYLSEEDNQTLTQLSQKHTCSKAMILRRLLSTYLHINSAAIESLF